MGVDELIVVGVGALIFNSKLEIPEEADFNPYDCFVRDGYDKNTPLAFFYKSEYLMSADKRHSNQLPTRLDRKNDGWSITDLDGDIYSKEEIIKYIINDANSQEGAESPQGKKFIADLEKYLRNGEDVYFGRFLYRYFS